MSYIIPEDEYLRKHLCVVCGGQINKDGSCDYCKIQKEINDRNR